ncbi:MAG: hypothetical protein DRO11_06265, partial [Methanobacteriota archaeon]
MVVPLLDHAGDYLVVLARSPKRRVELRLHFVDPKSGRVVLTGFLSIRREEGVFHPYKLRTTTRFGEEKLGSPKTVVKIFRAAKKVLLLRDKHTEPVSS